MNLAFRSSPSHTNPDGSSSREGDGADQDEDEADAWGFGEDGEGGVEGWANEDDGGNEFGTFRCIGMLLSFTSSAAYGSP